MQSDNVDHLIDTLLNPCNLVDVIKGTSIIVWYFLTYLNFVVIE